MFNKTYTDVVISLEEIEKRGFCLKANWLVNNLSIYMDVIGPPLEDGTDAYFFGNKLIFVTRWSEFTEEDIETVKNENYTLSMTTLNETAHFTLKFGSYSTNYVRTVYNTIFPMNDRNFPVEKFIFLFVDKATGEFIYERDVDVPQLEWELDFVNEKTYSVFSSKYGDIQVGLENVFMYGTDELIDSLITSETDWCDVLYQYSNLTFKDEFDSFNSEGVKAFPNTKYVTVGKNTVTKQW